MLNANGPGFAGLYAGDVVEFAPACGRDTRTATVLPLLVFQDHVQVAYGPHGYTVDASNFVRLVRRGKRHIAADAYATLATTAAPADFLAGHGNWGLNAAEAIEARRLALLATGKKAKLNE